MEQQGTDASGYTRPMGTDGTGRMGYGGQGNAGGGMGGGRRGYGSGSGGGMMDHSDPVAAIRDMLATANPEMRMQIRDELSNIM